MSGVTLFGLAFSPSELLAWSTAIGSLAWRPVRFAVRRAMGTADVRIDRISSLEDAVDMLRKVLDKGRIRENALVTVAEVLLFALDSIEEPCAVVRRGRSRALQILEAARAQAAGVADSGAAR